MGKQEESCDVCQKTFTYLSELTIHKRSHTGKSPLTVDSVKRHLNPHLN